MEEKKFNQQEYIANFRKERYERFSVDLPKGYRDKFKALAASQGLSMAKFIMKIVDESAES